jgi:nucleoside permease NupC
MPGRGYPTTGGDFLAGQVAALIEYTNDGIDVLFGRLVADKQETIFALQVLPVIIFLGALVGLLYYLRVIQWVSRSSEGPSPRCCARARSSRCTPPP